MDLPFHYGVYGIALRSDLQLDLPEYTGGASTQIELRIGSPGQFAEAIAGTELLSRSNWYEYALLDDLSSYIRWHGVGEFLVSARGERILCGRAPTASVESFQVYLLSPAISFALVKGGAEPLHGTAIEYEGGAIALLGNSGFGKSTLAASFIATGSRLVTDDLLLLRLGAGGADACPGPPRIKLLPESALSLLGPAAIGVPINANAQKHVISIEPAQHCRIAVPLRAMYVLAPPSDMRRQRRVRIEPLTAREAFVALMENAFNRHIADPDRLRRHLRETTRQVRAVPIKKLSYPRSVARLQEVREAILMDCGSSAGANA